MARDKNDISLIHGVGEDEIRMMMDILEIEHPEATKSLAGLRALRETLSSNHKTSQHLSIAPLHTDVSTDHAASTSPKSYVACHHAEEQDEETDPSGGKSAASVKILNQGKTRKMRRIIVGGNQLKVL